MGKVKEYAPGIYTDLSNEEYHLSNAVSKSQLDDIAVDPSVYIWRKTAPVDTEKTKALDMGTALHCLLLEPDEFKHRFIEAPEFNRRTDAGKQEEKDFIRYCEYFGKMALTHEQIRKLNLMRESTLAHPAARMLLEADGQCESSIFWANSETEELCRIRPDKYLNNRPLIADVKKVADMGRFSRHIHEFRYHVQAAMYSDGYENHFGEVPAFSFIAVSETIDCGRYPVRVFVLDDEDFDAGHQLYRKDLETYHRCRRSNQWGGFETIKRPGWARKEDNE